MKTVRAGSSSVAWRAFVKSSNVGLVFGAFVVKVLSVKAVQGVFYSSERRMRFLNRAEGYDCSLPEPSLQR